MKTGRNVPRVPELRVAACNDLPLRPDREWVVYWMTAQRRTRFNFALQRAADYARDLKKPLVVFEPLRCDYPWASDRLHRFVLQGMADNRLRLAGGPAAYYPYVEPRRGADHGLLHALAEKAAVVVTDDYPTFFLPRMLSRVAKSLPAKLEKVDSNGLLPMRATDLVFLRAYDFRRFLQKNLAPHLESIPQEDPLAGLQGKLPPAGPALAEIQSRWPAATDERLAASPKVLAELSIDHTVGPASFDGGPAAAERCLKNFLDVKLARYAEERSDPDADVASGLSPYLHFGCLSVHEVFAEIASREAWGPAKLRGTAGEKEGWWGMSPAAESFLDELVTWREVGFNFCSKRPDYDQYGSLPDWAQRTLAEHAADPRDALYTLDQFAAAATHDPVWNAAQRQLVQEGRMHNYLRMLWGKKILEWTPDPQEALRIMLELNNRYAVDGRDPNSYSGIFWVLGRYDRAWGPIRPVYGMIRYMSSENTVKKLRMKQYLKTYGPGSGVPKLF